MVTMLLDTSNGGGSDDQAEAEMGLIWSSGGNSNDISVIVGMGIVIAGMVIVGIVIAGIVIVGIVIVGIVIVGIVIVGIVIAGMGIVAAGAGTRAGLAFRPSFFRCMSCSK
jgi:hypothetical protein